jgi:polyphosphate kinase 2 (PPK2 family)
MLEQIRLDQRLSKVVYERRLPALQSRLFDLEHAIFKAGIPVAIVMEGWATAGKGTTIRVLSSRLDPRAFRVVPISAPRTFETRYPWLWRFWRLIPARGQIVVFDTAWYRRVLSDRVEKTVKKREWMAAFEDIHEFEEQLAADGTLILKFWMHISKKEQSRRMKRLRASRLTAMQVTKADVAQHKAYDKHVAAVEEMLARTDAPHAPWVIVEATDRHFARVKIFEAIIAALEKRLASESRAGAGARTRARAVGRTRGSARASVGARTTTRTPRRARSGAKRTRRARGA